MVEQHRLTSTEWVDIVDEDNEVIVQPSREQIRAQRLCHRVTYIVAYGGMGKILVQRHTEAKDLLPGILDITIGGVVQADEQMLESARREAGGELGIVGMLFIEHDQFCFGDQSCRIWGGLPGYVSHGLSALQEGGVSKVCWLTPEKITACCGEFTSGSLKALALQVARNVKNERAKAEKREEAE